jgi:hypothetical protein
VDVGFEQSKVDACLFFLRDQAGDLVGIVTAYVDDMLIVGTERVIAGIKMKLKAKFAMKDLGPLKRLLGVEYELVNDEEHQQHYWRVSLSDYLTQLYKETREVAMKLGLKDKLPSTPGTPGKALIYDELNDKVCQFEYRRCVGKLLFGMRKAWPHVSNCVRELSSHLDHPTMVHWAEAWQVVQYLYHHQQEVLRLYAPKELRVTAYVDASFAPPGKSRRSVAGILVTVGGCLVQWISKSEPTVALSSTESEYIAMSMCAQEVKFVSMLLQELDGMPNKLPSIICEDNTGAIFLGQNCQVGNRSKHIDTRFHFVREMIQSGELQVVYVPGEVNLADMCTKNLARNRFSKLADSVLCGQLGSIRREDVRKVERRESVCDKL